MLVNRPPRIDTQLLFPTPTGKLFGERNFYRDVWYPTVEVSGLDYTHPLGRSFEQVRKLIG